MQTIKLCDFGKSLGTRTIAREIRNTILQHFSEPVVLDFSEVEIINNAFADELIGALILHNGIDKLKAICKFKETNTEVKAVLKQVIYSNM